MKPLTTASTLEDFTGAYGRDWAPGVLSDHQALAEAAGLVVRVTASGGRWITGPDGGRAERIVCSEIIMVATEDGPMTGRCGLPVVGADGFCPGHQPDIPLDESCEHGLAAWLCMGPDHYPSNAQADAGLLYP